jgi:hypothetical protein
MNGLLFHRRGEMISEWLFEVDLSTSLDDEPSRANDCVSARTWRLQPISGI